MQLSKSVLFVEFVVETSQCV